VNGNACETSKWPTQNAVFIIGSGNEGREWGCPLAKTLIYSGASSDTNAPSQTDYKYPLMVFPCADYM
jgi:hypothetical protein